jgi:hypothetical protein
MLHVIGVQPGRPGASGLDVDAKRRLQALDSVENVDHAGDLFESPCGVCCRWLQHRIVGPEELHLDRSRVAAQVTQHVLENLDELDAQTRDLARDARAYVGDDFLDRPPFGSAA